MSFQLKSSDKMNLLKIDSKEIGNGYVSIIMTKLIEYARLNNKNKIFGKMVWNDEEHKKSNASKQMMITISLVFIVLSLWSTVSYMHVSPQRLSDTTVPHLITARIILGTPGRIIMGCIIIASCLGAVNALLTGSSRILSNAGYHDFSRPFFLSQSPADDR